MVFFASISEKSRVAMAKKQIQSRYPNTMQVNGDKLENISVCVPAAMSYKSNRENAALSTCQGAGQTTNEIK